MIVFAGVWMNSDLIETYMDLRCLVIVDVERMFPLVGESGARVLH